MSNFVPNIVFSQKNNFYTSTSPSIVQCGIMRDKKGQFGPKSNIEGQFGSISNIEGQLGLLSNIAILLVGPNCPTILQTCDNELKNVGQ